MDGMYPNVPNSRTLWLLPFSYDATNLFIGAQCSVLDSQETLCLPFVIVA